MPNILDASILFTTHERINLDDVKENLQKAATNIQKESRRYADEKKKIQINDKKKLELIQKEVTAEREEIYQIKFGEIIPPEVLDGIEPTQKLESLQKEFKKEEKITIRKIEIANQELKQSKQDLLKIKEMNTQIIKTITDKGNKLLHLNKDLDSLNSNITKEDKDMKKADMTKFRQNMIEIIKLLNEQIKSVKYDIDIFKNKGGKIQNLMNVQNNREITDDYMD